MPEETETETTRVRRSTLQKEMDSLEALIRILKPLTDDQRQRLLKTASIMIGSDSQIVEGGG